MDDAVVSKQVGRGRTGAGVFHCAPQRPVLVYDGHEGHAWGRR